MPRDRVIKVKQVDAVATEKGDVARDAAEKLCEVHGATRDTLHSGPVHRCIATMKDRFGRRPESGGQGVLLVENYKRFELRSIEVFDEIKETAVRASNGAIRAALAVEHSGEASFTHDNPSTARLPSTR